MTTGEGTCRSSPVAVSSPDRAGLFLRQPLVWAVDEASGRVRLPVVRGWRGVAGGHGFAARTCRGAGPDPLRELFVRHGRAG